MPDHEELRKWREVLRHFVDAEQHLLDLYNADAAQVHVDLAPLINTVSKIVAKLERGKR